MKCLFQETVGSGFKGEDVKTLSKNALKFRGIRLVLGNKGAGVCVTGGLGDLKA